MWLVHPSATCVVAPKPLKTLDDCVNFLGQLHNNCFAPTWINIYTGLHEGLSIQEPSIKRGKALSIGHALARDLDHACALLDYCVRRGCNVSCNNEHNKTVLQLALGHIICIKHPSAGLPFFQVLADTHALFDVSKNNTGELIRHYIDVVRDDHFYSKTVGILEQVAVMFDE
jgi:hypothetical protein